MRFYALHSMVKQAAEVRQSKALRVPSVVAWRVGGTPRKPRSHKPGGKSAMPTAPPPSPLDYYRDVIKSYFNPARGFRQTQVG